MLAGIFAGLLGWAAERWFVPALVLILGLILFVAAQPARRALVPLEP